MFAGLAATAVVAVGLPGGGAPQQSAELGPAAGAPASTEPSGAAPSGEADCLDSLEVDLGEGRMPTRDDELSDLVNAVKPGDVEKPGEPTLVAPCEIEPSSAGQGQALPITFALQDWNCGLPADDKIPCAGPNNAWLTFVVRDAAEHEAWVGDADKGGSSVWVSDVHGNYFVSVQGELRGASVEHVAGAISFAPTWTR